MSPRSLVVVLGLVVAVAACGIKGSPRPPAPPPQSIPPPDAGTP